MPARPVRGVRKKSSAHRPPKKPRQVVRNEASAVTDEERDFFLEWGGKRNLEKQYIVLALTYWMRVKSRIWTSFYERPKEFYMVACVHVAMKWLGYDEVLKCNFIQDLREIGPIPMDAHQGIEFLILTELGWDL